MLNGLASLAMSASILKALSGKLDIKRHSPSVLYICCRHNKLKIFSGQNIGPIKDDISELDAYLVQMISIAVG